MPQAFCSASDPDPKRDFELDIFTSMRYNESDGSQVRVPVHPQATAEEALRTDVLSWYLRLLTPEFMERALSKEGVQQNNRLYNPLVVMWLMAYQRFHGKASMERALGRVFEGLLAQPGGAASVFGRRAFFVDGTSLRAPHRPAMKQAFPPTSNQHGESHFPVLKMLVAHDIETGLAMPPVWGAMSGEQAVSEQALFEKLLRERVPAGAVLVGDINFGVFSVAYAADQHQNPVVLRMQERRARALLGGPLEDGIDREMEWRAGHDDRKRHPELPADACVRGRLLVALVRPDNGAEAFLLALFTTLPATEASREDLLQLYGKRWNIELDLRTLKGTLKLEQLTCTSPEMIAKEIHAAMITYNLVRAVMYAAAAQSGLAPRGYSFARVRHVVEHFLPFIAAAQTPEEAQALTDKMMECVGQKKLRNRKGRRSYPRAAWGRPRTFPCRKAETVIGH